MAVWRQDGFKNPLSWRLKDVKYVFMCWLSSETGHLGRLFSLTERSFWNVVLTSVTYLLATFFVVSLQWQLKGHRFECKNLVKITFLVHRVYWSKILACGTWERINWLFLYCVSIPRIGFPFKTSNSSWAGSGWVQDLPSPLAPRAPGTALTTSGWRLTK